MISYKRQLPFRYLKRKDAFSSDIMQYMPKSEKTIWTSSIRLGLLDVFSSLSFEEKEFVLLPAIAPQGLVLPLQKKGIKYHFYHLKVGFQVDLDSVETFIKTGKCRVVLFIHYFGQFNPQIYDVKRICDDNKVYLFEDFVHGLFGKDDRMRPLGSIGDISFCSLSKFLPVPDGALLFVNNDGIQIKTKEKQNLFWRFSIGSHIISLLLNNVAAKCKVTWLYKLISSLSKVHYAIYYNLLCGLSSNHAVSKVTLNILRHIDLDKFIRDRQEIFGQIDDKYRCYHRSFMAPGYPILSPGAQRERSVWREKNVETLSYIKGWQFVPPSSDYDFERELQLSHYLLPLNAGILPCL